MSLESKLVALIAVIAAEFNGRGSVPVGMLGYWPTTTAPADWLVCDGSAIVRASYTALDAVLWCGSGNNATASWGYRSTSAVSPAANRSTSGTYLVLPDLRNRYIRGWQSGGSYGFWTYYEDELESHTHPFGVRLRTNALVANDPARPELGDTSNTAGTSATGATGGTETRPRTVMALPIIYAGPA